MEIVERFRVVKEPHARPVRRGIRFRNGEGGALGARLSQREQRRQAVRDAHRVCRASTRSFASSGSAAT